MGYPLDSRTLRLLVRDYLYQQGRVVPKFKEHPWVWLCIPFWIATKIYYRTQCATILKDQGLLCPLILLIIILASPSEFKYVLPSHIIDYEETALFNDPGKKKLIFRLSCKYPERVLNLSKASTSIMFSATAEGKILPPYVVYKAQHLYESWKEGGGAPKSHNITKRKVVW